VTWPVEALAAAVGGKSNLVRMIDGGNVHRAYRDGLTDRQADRWAVRCGLHPFEVWPDMLDAAIESVMVACPHCASPFLPVAKNHRFCSTPCRTEAHRRTPAGAAANRTRRRRGYAESAEYERARERRRYQAKSAVSS
jgi:hypothetical protein